MSPQEVRLTEWQELLPEEDNFFLRHYLDDPLAKALVADLNARGVVEITELRNGLRVVSNSHVGSVRIGDLQLIIQPKIKGLPLYRLLKYAYELRNLKLFGNASYNLAAFSFKDLLIYHLCVEAEEIVFRGLHKKYILQKDDLSVIRGRVDLNRLVSQTGFAMGTLPCVYFSRLEDNELNQVFFAGLNLASDLTHDVNLKSRLHRLSLMMQESVRRVKLTKGLLSKVESTLNRLEEHYRPLLQLIHLLFEAQGFALHDQTASLESYGFFFNMNHFFQTLVSRLLSDYLKDYSVRDEHTLHESFAYASGFNPLARLTPKPRPDFAVLEGSKVKFLLDAKYRDLWENSLPANWLYQLTIYATSGAGAGLAKILYPAMSETARLQIVDVRDPSTGRTSARVLLQPLHLLRVAKLLDSRERKERQIEQYVAELVFSGTGAIAPRSAG